MNYKQVKAVMVYRTEEGKDFDSEKEAVQHERQSNAERRLMDIMKELAKQECPIGCAHNCGADNCKNYKGVGK